MEKLGDLINGILPSVDRPMSFKLIGLTPDLPDGKIGSVYEWTGRYFEGPGEVVVFFHGYVGLKFEEKVEVLGNGRFCVRNNRPGGDRGLFREVV